MPEKDFILPQLREGKQLGVKLAEYLKMKLTIRDSAILQGVGIGRSVLYLQHLERLSQMSLVTEMI